MDHSSQNLITMRQHAVQIFQAGLRAVEPGAAIARCCQRQGDLLSIKDQTYDLSGFDSVYVIGAGKAGASMAQAVEALLGDHLSEGAVIVKYDHRAELQKIILYEAGHPLPDANGQRAAQTLLELARRADERSLVICLISGGGSALLPVPVEGLTLADKQETTRLLLACGATIHEINTIRKHLSAIKGGQLARAVFPATLVSLILSDVVGDDLDTIASGPCVPDHTTFADCLRIVDRYAIADQLPTRVLNTLQSGIAGGSPETPKAGDAIFDRTYNVIVGSNFDALSKARDAAVALDYNTLILSSSIEGETSVVAGMHMAVAHEILRTGHPLKTPACILSGGETTVTLKGAGRGGRNQEFALAAAVKIGNAGNVVVLSAGTDGTDGPTDAAGAFVDNTTAKRAACLGLDLQGFLAENDSCTCFELLGDLYKTGPTNTNVMDLRILLVT